MTDDDKDKIEIEKARADFVTFGTSVMIDGKHVELRDAPSKVFGLWEKLDPSYWFTEHLGDGVYASFDGFQLWLAANDHRNKVIAIEPVVMIALERYVKMLREKGAM